MKITVFRHKGIFSKIGISRGGVTLVPRYKMQTSNHQALLAKDM